MKGGLLLETDRAVKLESSSCVHAWPAPAARNPTYFATSFSFFFSFFFSIRPFSLPLKSRLFVFVSVRGRACVFCSAAARNEKDLYSSFKKKIFVLSRLLLGFFSYWINDFRVKRELQNEQTELNRSFLSLT